MGSDDDLLLMIAVTIGLALVMPFGALVLS